VPDHSSIRRADQPPPIGEHLRLLLDQLPIIPFMCSADGNFKTFYISDRVREVTGYRPEQFYDDYAFFLDRLHPDDREWVPQSLPHVLETGSHEVEYQWRHADGSYRWMLVMMRVIAASNGTPRQIVGAWMDVTNRKHAEEAARQAVADSEAHRESLERANQELEAFSYSVSHDLRAPLRAMHGFVTAFEDEYGRQVDDEGRRLLGVIARNTRKMGRLIDDLLEFSRAGRRTFEPRILDMTKLVQIIFRELHERESDRTIELRLTPLPVAFADPAMIRQVWVNLIGNAIKYTRPRATARVEVGGREDGDHARFWVRDNGVGFDMSYIHKLFGVFQRLHKERDFEGTGVGLALVRRIVERHGGTVVAQGTVDEGARFEFTLPLRASSHA